ncbi:hypothetical protein E2320_001366, partial [Naja naja]
MFSSKTHWEDFGIKYIYSFPSAWLSVYILFVYGNTWWIFVDPQFL